MGSGIIEPFTVTQAGRPGELSSRQSQMVADYIWENYYGKYPNQIFEWQSSPLVVTFDPMELKSDERYTIKKWTGRAVDQLTMEEDWEEKAYDSPHHVHVRRLYVYDLTGLMALASRKLGNPDRYYIRG